MQSQFLPQLWLISYSHTHTHTHTHTTHVKSRQDTSQAVLQAKQWCHRCLTQTGHLMIHKVCFQESGIACKHPCSASNWCLYWTKTSRKSACLKLSLHGPVVVRYITTLDQIHEAVLILQKPTPSMEPVFPRVTCMVVPDSIWWGTYHNCFVINLNYTMLMAFLDLALMSYSCTALNAVGT